MNNNSLNCTENTKLWHFIYKYEKINKKKLILNLKQKYELCKFVNGQIFNASILRSIFK